MTEYLGSVAALKRMLHKGVHLEESLGDSSPLTRQITYGVTRNYFSLSKTLDNLLDKPIDKKNSDIKLLLMCGLYSIEHLNRPSHASVNFAVEAAAKMRKPWAKGLINAVLRNFIRGSRGTRRDHRNLLEAELNHPEWLISLLNTAWDRPEIFQANQARPPMTLRLNFRKTDRENYLQILYDAGISAKPGSLLATSVILNKPMEVTDIPGFKDGLVSIQDEGAQLAGTLLNTKRGDAVLDACAAPGGKTGHLLEKTDISVTAIDWDKKRIQLIGENLKRLGLNANILCLNLGKWETKTKYDCILLDVPCSATGIIRRHPEIKLLRTKSDLDKLTRIQSLLLNKVFNLLVAGGELLYSTCSILPVENDEIISRFLSSRPDAKQLQIISRSNSKEIISTKHGLQLLPTIADHDGFYYSKLTKVPR